MSEWKDESTFSQRDKERVPWLFSITFGGIELRVHRHIHYPGQWLATTRPDIIEHRELKSDDIFEAQSEAISILRCVLERSLREIESLP